MAELKAVMIGPQHLGQVDHLHKVQERVIKQEVDRPELLDGDHYKWPVLLAVGVENEKAKLIGGMYVEATGECCLLGVSPKATEEILKLAPDVYEFLQSRGVRWLRIFIPQEMKEELDPKLREAGLSCQDKVLSHYAIDLRR